MKWFKDLFFGPGNLAFDLGRILAFWGVVAMLAGAIWNVLLGLPIDLGPTGFGGGLAAVLTGCAALIYAKDRARAEVRVADSVSDCPPGSAARAGKPMRRRK